MKNKHLQKTLFCILIMYSNFSIAQEINNNLHGYYIAKSDAAMYSSFEFDGNGKVSIIGMELRDFFIKGDTLIIYPDKSIFKFKIKKGQLIGASSWVENETWIKKDTIVPNNRRDDAKAKKNANLMNEYYNLIGDKSSLDFLFDEQKSKEQSEKLNTLCDKGLSKACLDYFGMMIIEGQDISLLLNPNAKVKLTPENPKIIALGNKIINQGELEGYAVLGSYYYLLGNKDQAMQQWKLGSEKGDLKSSMAIFDIEMEADEEKTKPLKKAATPKKKRK